MPRSGYRSDRQGRQAELGRWKWLASQDRPNLILKGMAMIEKIVETGNSRGDVRISVSVRQKLLINRFLKS